MNFNEAIQLLKKGKAVRRKAWIPYFIRLRPYVSSHTRQIGTYVIQDFSTEPEECEHIFTARGYTFDIADYEAEDWYEVPNIKYEWEK